MNIKRYFRLFISPYFIPMYALAISVLSTSYFYDNNLLIAYGDAESHLNIAKKVIDSLTPGAAQLGGVWLPVPHILMIPFVFFDPLWRSGIAGSIVSGLSFIITSIFLYKLVFLLTKSRIAAFFSFLVLSSNPNILYMQSTPMSELPLMMFFILSIYFFFKFIKSGGDVLSLILAAFFGFLASLSRYDGWFLVLFEAISIIIFYITKPKLRKEMEGKFILFSALAFFGILVWMMWDLLILGDPFYFTNSQFSAKAQQQNWMLRGELPAYQNFPLSLLYYFVTSMINSGVLVFIISLLGFVLFALKEKGASKIIYIFILLTPFIFYVFTLFAGQSVIFIPQLTPANFEWHLFNVRYGLMMIPVIAFFLAYLFRHSGFLLRILLVIALFFQVAMYRQGYANVITLDDGTVGLSATKSPDAQRWLSRNYDGGLVLIDDYARTISIIKSGIPMQNVIYIGNKPYWDDSLKEPEKYAKWIVMQNDDAVWKSIYDNPSVRGRLFKYFKKVYTSPQILIFKRQ